MYMTQGNPFRSDIFPFLTYLLLACLAGPVAADQAGNVEDLAEVAREMTVGNVALKAIIDYQLVLISFGEADPEQARFNRQTREQCTALVEMNNLCAYLIGTFADPERVNLTLSSWSRNPCISCWPYCWLPGS